MFAGYVIGKTSELLSIRLASVSLYILVELQQPCLNPRLFLVLAAAASFSSAFGRCNIPMMPLEI